MNGDHEMGSYRKREKVKSHDEDDSTKMNLNPFRKKILELNYGIDLEGLNQALKSLKSPLGPQSDNLNQKMVLIWTMTVHFDPSPFDRPYEMVHTIFLVGLNRTFCRDYWIF